MDYFKLINSLKYLKYIKTLLRVFNKKLNKYKLFYFKCNSFRYNTQHYDVNIVILLLI
jgi:hypothetical protein